MLPTPPRRSHRPSEWAKIGECSSLAVEEDALVGHEHVVEDDEPLGHDVPAADREVAGRQVGRGAYVVLMIFTPGALTGTAQAMA